MKKILSAMLIFALVFLLSSCGKSDSADEIKHQFKNVSYRGTAILDKTMCSFETVKIEPNAKDGYTLCVRFKNKTVNKNLMFSLSMVSVNGIMCDPYWGYNAAPGEDISQNVVWSRKLLESNSITDPTDIELTLRVYDYDDRSKNDLYTERFIIYPFGQSKAVPHERVVDEDNIIVFDNAGYAMIVKKCEYNKKTGFTVTAYIENKTDKNVIFSLGKSTVNNTTVVPYWSQEVAGEKCANVSINWTQKQLEEAEISGEITDVEFLMNIISTESGEKLLHQTYTLSPCIKMK